MFFPKGLGDILGGEIIYWLDSTLDGSTSGCSYGTRTRECASDFLYHDNWEDCTGNSPVDEDCNNGIDDDCDGYADDQDTTVNSYYEGSEFTADCGSCNTDLTRDCSENYQGACGIGTETNSCDFANNLYSYSGWTGCAAPVTEVCGDVGNVDEDCDGLANDLDDDCFACTPEETRDCYNGPDGTEGVGTCSGGIQTCEAGFWGACVGEQIPESEECNDANGDDEDCDYYSNSYDSDCQIGSDLLVCNEGTSEEFDCGYPLGLGECSEGGQFTAECFYDSDMELWQFEEWDYSIDPEGLECTGATWPVEEICFNGLDDDCDGDTDEGCTSEDFVPYYVKNHYFISGAPALTNNVRNGIESSLEVGSDGAAQIVYWDEVDESGQHLAYAKYVGVGGNCGYEGSPSNPQVVNNLYCEFIDVGDGVAVLVDQENDLVLDSSDNAHVAYIKTDWNNYPFFSLNYAKYVGSGGNCGYDSTLVDLAHTPVESINQKWDCNSLVEGDMMYSPNLVLIDGNPYFTYLIGTNLEVGNFVSGSYNSLNSHDLDYDTSFGSLASHYEEGVLYNLVLTNNYKIIYVEYDVSSGAFTSITVSEEINPSGVIGLTEIDLNIDLDGTVHIVYPSDYSEDTGEGVIQRMKLVHKIKSGSSFIDYSLRPDVFDIDAGFDAQIEFTLDNFPVIAYETGLYNPVDSDAPVYSRLQSDVVNWEHGSMDDSGLKSGHYVEIDLDSQNKIHSAFVRVRSAQDPTYLEFLTYSVMIPPVE